MAVTNAQVTVSTSAVALNPASASTGVKLTVKNTHATDALVLGDSSVSTSNGFSLAAGATLQLDLPAGTQVFGVRAGAADITAHVLRVLS